MKVHIIPICNFRPSIMPTWGLQDLAHPHWESVTVMLWQRACILASPATSLLAPHLTHQHFDK